MNTSYLAVGYECNHQCICCPLTTFDRLHRALSLAEIESRLDCVEADCTPKHLVLSGGEPMLHPDFLEIVRLAAKKGFSITVLSNASMCRDKTLVGELSAVQPIHGFTVVTAIHSSSPQIHDRLTGINGSLLDTLEGLDHLVDAGIHIRIKHIFNRISIGTLTDTVKYLDEHFSKDVGLEFCTMDYSGRAAKNVKELFITMNEIKPHLENALDYLEQSNKPRRFVSIIESPLCMIDPYYWKYFSAPGNDFSYYIAPNTGSKGIVKDVGNECGSYYPPCKSCSVKTACCGTWRSAYQYQSATLLQPIHGEIVDA